MLPLTYQQTNHASVLSPTLDSPQPGHCVMTTAQMYQIASDMDNRRVTGSDEFGFPLFWEHVGPDPFVSSSYPQRGKAAQKFQGSGGSDALPCLPAFCFTIHRDPVTNHSADSRGNLMTLARSSDPPLHLELPALVYMPIPDPGMQTVTIARPPHTRLFLGTLPAHRDNVFLLLDPIEAGQPSVPLVFRSAERKFNGRLYHSLTTTQLREAYLYARLLWTYR